LRDRLLPARGSVLIFPVVEATLRQNSSTTFQKMWLVTLMFFPYKTHISFVSANFVTKIRRLYCVCCNL